MNDEANSAGETPVDPAPETTPDAPAAEPAPETPAPDEGTPELPSDSPADPPPSGDGAGGIEPNPELYLAKLGEIVIYQVARESDDPLITANGVDELPAIVVRVLEDQYVDLTIFTDSWHNGWKQHVRNGITAGTYRPL